MHPHTDPCPCRCAGACACACPRPGKHPRPLHRTGALPPLRRTRLASLLGAGLAAAGMACAGPLADPTRPPSIPGGAGPAAPHSGAAAPAARALPPVAEPAQPLPVLQSVQMPAQGPALAMIDGRLVKAGDSVDGWRVLSIDSEGLVLNGRAGNERLWLLSGSPKQAPGSILTLRTASYLPAAAATDGAEAGRGAGPGPGPGPGNTLPQPASPGPLSVAGRTSP